ncbi:MAG: hypothetical protein IKR48_13000 [Kiritimatiellae bacterium]|nr:hypothetical protein [Kiritimatiellia bacterium]
MKVGQSGFCVILSLAAGLAPLSAFSGTYYVHPDGVDPLGRSWTAVYSSVNTAVSGIHNNEKADEVVIAAGTYNLTDALGCAGAKGAGTKDIIRGETGNPDDVILVGPGDCELLRLAFNVEVSGITFTNGYIRNESCNGSIRIGDSNSGTTYRSVVSNCVVTGCHNPYTTEQGTRDNNKAVRGAAVCIYNNGLLIDSIVRNNTAEYRGAGIRFAQSDATAVRCLITGNVATNTSNSGATGVYAEANTSACMGQLIDCIVQSNLATFCAGFHKVKYMEGCMLLDNRLWTKEHSSVAAALGGVFTMTNCIVSGNCATDCWATVNIGETSATTPGLITGCTFSNNTLVAETRNDCYGSAILVNSGGNKLVRIENCLFDGNAVVTNAPSMGGRGAITLAAGTLSMVDCVFTNNTATYGPAFEASNNDSCLHCTNTTFIGNHALECGGAVRLRNATKPLVFSDCKFLDNIAYYGSALQIQGKVNVTLDQCELSGNQSQPISDSSNSRGAIRLQENGTCLQMNSCVFSNNLSALGSCLDQTNTTTSRCDNCTFQGNRSRLTGGVARICNSANATFLNSRFIDNCMYQNSVGDNYGGGAIFLWGLTPPGWCTVSNCVFAGNTVGARGGAIGASWNIDTYFTIDSCIFTNNSSAAQGGAVSIREKNAHENPGTIRNCFFAFNRTTSTTVGDRSGGGLLLVTPSDVIVSSCTFVSNNSNYASGNVHHRWGGSFVNCTFLDPLVKGQVDTGDAWCREDGSNPYTYCCVSPALPLRFTQANHCLNEVPLFEDAANGNYTPAANSPQFNNGVLETWMTDSTTDLYGNPRVWGRGVDIGCAERIYQVGTILHVR